MIKELLNAYKIVKYGLRPRKQLMFALFFAAIGIVLEIVSKGRNLVGAFYIILTGLFIHQLIISSDMSTLVQSSPYKKKIQCVYPIISVTPWIYLSITILVIINAISARESAEAYDAMCRMTMQLAMLVFTTVIYFAFSYKYFVLSTIVLFAVACFLPSIFAWDNPISMMFTDYGVCVLTLYLSATVGIMISWFASRLVYKKEFSRIAFMGLIKK
jgi:hypothetical protein